MPAPTGPKKLSELLHTYRPSKSMQNNEAGSLITSLDFDDTGEFLLAACDDNTIQLYDCKLGKHSKQLFSKKYGVHLARFTHSEQQCIYASTKQDDTIRYLSLHDNNYIRYFRGHKAPVVSLELCPVNDTFLSASLDDTVRIWDLRSQNAHGCLNLPSLAHASYDPTGVIFAVASHNLAQVFLYDVRYFDREPFASFPVEDNGFLHQYSYPPRMPEWTKVEFSNDGKYLLLGTRGNAHYVMDSYKGDMICRLQRSGPTPVGRDGNGGPASVGGDVCFTPDARYIIGGQGDKSLAMWDVYSKTIPKDKTVKPFHELESPKTPASVMAFNPRHHICASAHKEVSFWLPDIHANSPSPPRD